MVACPSIPTFNLVFFFFGKIVESIASKWQVSVQATYWIWSSNHRKRVDQPKSYAFHQIQPVPIFGFFFLGWFQLINNIICRSHVDILTVIRHVVVPHTICHSSWSMDRHKGKCEVFHVSESNALVKCKVGHISITPKSTRRPTSESGSYLYIYKSSFHSQSL